MDILWWISGGAVTQGMEHDLVSAAPTVLLSLLVACGYAVIAFNWYFQSRLAARDSRTALRRLRGIAITSIACAAVFVLADMGWSFWRLYDVALLVLAAHTWWFVLRMRGMSLVNERLARAAELERFAEDQKRAAAESAKQAREKVFFFNALSHDLRAPLNNVVLNAQLLKLSALENQDLNQSADVVIENAIAAGDLVTKLLEFARLGSENHNDLAPVRLDAVLQQIERRFHPIAAAKGLSVRLIGDKPVELTTDRMKLERILSNLVDNAIKFTTAGGITLEMTTSDTAITIAISDTGSGIPPRDVPHLFEEFYQVRNREHDGRKGFGMGLAICRSLARQLGGNVTLARTGPAGTRFDLSLPPTIQPVSRSVQGPSPAQNLCPA